MASCLPGACCPPDRLGEKHNVALRNKFSLLREKSALKLHSQRLSPPSQIQTPLPINCCINSYFTGLLKEMQPVEKGRQSQGRPWEKVGLGTAQAILQCCWHNLPSTQCY